MKRAALIALALTGCLRPDPVLGRIQLDLDAKVRVLEALATKRDVARAEQARLRATAALVESGLDIDGLTDKLAHSPPATLDRIDRQGPDLRVHGPGGAMEALSVCRTAAALAPSLVLRELSVRPRGWSATFSPQPALQPGQGADTPPIPPAGPMSRFGPDGAVRAKIAQDQQRLAELEKDLGELAELPALQWRVGQEVQRAALLEALPNAVNALAPLLRDEPPLMTTGAAALNGDILELRAVRLRAGAAPDEVSRALAPGLRETRKPFVTADGSLAISYMRNTGR